MSHIKPPSREQQPPPAPSSSDPGQFAAALKYLRDAPTSLTLEDNYGHSGHSRATYTAENIPYDGSDEVEVYVGCDCEGHCVPETCPCVSRYGPAYTDDKLLVSIVAGTSRAAPILECGEQCGCCVTYCPNRVVGLGPVSNLSVVDARSKGAGLKSKFFIRKGQFVCEYAGELITDVEANERWKKKSGDADAKNYIFMLNERSQSEGGTVKEMQTIIDAEVFGNIGRYINHSCDPNLERHMVRSTYVTPRLCFFAKRDIPPGEELTVSYAGLVPQDRSSEASKENGWSYRCFCGSRKCTGYLPYEPEET